MYNGPLYNRHHWPTNVYMFVQPFHVQIVQWKPSILNTIGTGQQMCLFNGDVLCRGIIKHDKVSKWDKKSVPCSEVSLFEGIL